MSTKKLLTYLAALIAGITLIGLIYQAVTSSRSQPEAASTSQSEAEAPWADSPLEPSQAIDLRLGDLAISYPADWLILFSPILDAKTPTLTPIYFVRTLAEYREHALCATTGSCTTSPLMITFSPRTTIWTGYSLGDYIRTTDPDYPLDSLAETTLGQFTGLAGYADFKELTYQALIPTSDTTFQQLTITATEDSREMLAVFADSLTTLTIIDSNFVTQPSGLSHKQAFTLKISARLATTDYKILQLVMDNILEPIDASSSANYILYTEGSTPPDNYLDYTYSLLTDNPDLVAGDYSTSQITATLTDAPIADFAPFLGDPKYCRENTDCVYRSDFCSRDSYNRYHLFRTPWGCGAVDYVGLGNSIDLSESLDCDDGLDITYDSLECVANQCVVNSPVPVCKEDQ